MKKILFVAGTAVMMLMLGSATAQAQRAIVRLTRFEGQAITGVAAEDMFRIELIKSSETKAVVEIDAELERYLRFERRADGTVAVELSAPDGERRRIERNNGWRRRTLKMTVYLPEIQNISLGDMTQLTADGAFTAAAARIELEDMSRIHRLDLTADDISVQLEDMSNASLSIHAQTLTAKIGDMSTLTVSGEVREVKSEVGDMSTFTGSGLHAERAHIEVSDMSKASIHVTQYLYGRSGAMARIDYEGNPHQIDLKTPRRTIRTNNP